MRQKVLAFSAVAEGATGIALMLAPAIVIRLLVGLEASVDGMIVGRCFGGALLALGIACWPDLAAQSEPKPNRAMLVYNALIAAFLAYATTGLNLYGLLLWPAVGLHALIALLLVWPLRRTI